MLRLLELKEGFLTRWRIIQFLADMVNPLRNVIQNPELWETRIHAKYFILDFT